ncbi:hypothetical protein EDB84DRAFT_1439816 [Lactarius hengduanensis]|nr:hypothetical protein EDB84DRAFT_1439816 [Lactarius hengduanensis]
MTLTPNQNLASERTTLEPNTEPMAREKSTTAMRVAISNGPAAGAVEARKEKKKKEKKKQAMPEAENGMPPPPPPPPINTVTPVAPTIMSTPPMTQPDLAAPFPQSDSPEAAPEMEARDGGSPPPPPPPSTPMTPVIPMILNTPPMTQPGLVAPYPQSDPGGTPPPMTLPPPPERENALPTYLPDDDVEMAPAFLPPQFGPPATPSQNALGLHLNANASTPILKLSTMSARLEEVENDNSDQLGRKPTKKAWTKSGPRAPSPSTSPPFAPTCPTFLFTLKGFITTTTRDVFPVIKEVWNCDKTRNFAASLTNAVPEDERESVAREIDHFLYTLNIATLDIKEAGNTLNPRFNVYADSSQISHDEIWRRLRSFLVDQTYESEMQGHGTPQHTPYICTCLPQMLRFYQRTARRVGAEELESGRCRRSSRRGLRSEDSPVGPYGIGAVDACLAAVFLITRDVGHCLCVHLGGAYGAPVERPGERYNGADHPRGLCPFPSVTGWNGPDRDTGGGTPQVKEQ